MGPGNIFDQRPLPLRPILRKGVFSAVAKLLGGRRNATDLHEELSQVVIAFREEEPDQARIRLRRTIENLNQIERNGSQFVLNNSDWHAIRSVAAHAMQTAKHAGAHQDVVEMLKTVTEKLEAFGFGKLEKS